MDYSFKNIIIEKCRVLHDGSRSVKLNVIRWTVFVCCKYNIMRTMNVWSAFGVHSKSSPFPLCDPATFLAIQYLFCIVCPLRTDIFRIVLVTNFIRFLQSFARPSERAHIRHTRIINRGQYYVSDTYISLGEHRQPRPNRIS